MARAVVGQNPAPVLLEVSLTTKSRTTFSTTVSPGPFGWSIGLDPP